MTSLYIGLMSGTSMDGIDAALVDVATHRLVSGIVRPYGLKAQQWLQEVSQAKTLEIGRLHQLNTLIGQEFAEAVHQLLACAKVSHQDIVAVGSHGQTIAHDANAEIPYTIQVGCPHTIAQSTSLTVVADFRTRDLVVGGQGAPFAPLYHEALFSSYAHPLAIVNVGGIANVTYLTAPSEFSSGHPMLEGCRSRGYDIGPGNCLMDFWAQTHLKQPFDRGGEWAAIGMVLPSLLDALLTDAYFTLPTPKSVGKEYFSQAWLNSYLSSAFQPKDVQATLLALTATTIAQALKSSHLDLQRVLLCGGGAHNQALQKKLKEQLPPLQIESTQVLGIDPDFIEAMMFAWLAEKTLSQKPVDLSQITGARVPAILGAVYR